MKRLKNNIAAKRPSMGWVWAGVVLGLLTAFWLRLFALDRFGFWDGEIHNVFHAARPLVEMPQAFRVYTAHPPLWFILTHFMLEVDPSVWWLRIPSVLIGVLGVAAGFVLARRFLPPPAALTVLWLLAFSPLLLRWAQAVRMYAAFTFFSILAMYFALRLLEAKSNRAWIGYGVSTLLNLYTHYFAAFALASTALLIVLAAARQVLLGKDERSSLGSAGQIMGLAIKSGVLVFFGYLPWFWAVARYNFVERQAEREGGGNERLNVSAEFFYTLFQDIAGSTAWVTWVLIALALIGVIYFIRRGRGRESLLMALSFLIPVLVIIIIDPRRFHAKYLAHLVPLVAILLVGGILMLRRIIGLWFTDVARSAVAGAVSLALIGLILVPNLALNESYYRGDAAAFQDSTEPTIWRFRGSWPIVMDKIAEGDHSLLLSLYPTRSRCSFLCQMAGVEAYISPEAEDRLMNMDWEAARTLDLWWVGTDGATKEDIAPPADLPLGDEVVSGPNVKFWHTRLQVTQVTDLLPNGGFEAEIASNAGSGADLSGWVVRDGDLNNFEIISEPVAEGNHSLKSSHQGSASLSTDLLHIASNSLFVASLDAPHLILGFHRTTPRVAISFMDAEGNALRDVPMSVMHYNLPFSRLTEQGWQRTVAHAAAPTEARYIVLTIEFENPGFDSLVVVDNVHLYQIEWEPEE